MSSTYGRICLTLRLWSWPMKCQRKSGCASALASSSCARFSPSSVSPAASSTCSSSSATYLTAASSSISAGSRPARFAASAISASTRSRPLRDGLDLEAGDQARHTTPACRPVTPWSRRCEKNSPGSAHIVHRLDVVDLLDPGCVQLRARHLGQVEVLGAHPRVVALEGLVDLLADLVAAAARRRAERGGDLRLARRARAGRSRPRPRSRRRARASRRAAPRRRRRRRA